MLEPRVVENLTSRAEALISKQLVGCWSCCSVACFNCGWLLLGVVESLRCVVVVGCLVQCSVVARLSVSVVVGCWVAAARLSVSVVVG